MQIEKVGLGNGSNGIGHLANGVNGTILKNGKLNGNIPPLEKSDKRVERYEKVFVERESILTELLKVKEFQTIYNIVIAALINIVLYQAINDYLQTGRIDLGFSNIAWLFQDPLKWLSILLALHSFPMLILYPTLKIWSDNRPTSPKSKKLWDQFFSSGIVFLAGTYLYIPWGAIRGSSVLSPGAASIIVLEQLRIGMKMYAFSWVNISRILKNDELPNKPTMNGISTLGDQTDLKVLNGQNGVAVNKEARNTFENISTFSQLAYFLYAPTLIYRDSYPRTKEIRWGFALWNLLNIFGCIFLYNFIQMRYGHTLFKQFGKDPENPMSPSEIISGLFGYILSGGIAYYLGAFVLLHFSQNCMAEVLRFADRSFYRDWWTSTSFNEYFRKQNSIVQDFLYQYLFKEIKKSLGPRHKYLPGILVIVISALWHEYIFIYSLQFFFPALLFLFGGPGMIMAFIGNQNFPILGNIFVNWALMFGCGLIHSAYNIEYYARVNGCPGLENPVTDFFIPRSLNCAEFSWK